MDKYKKKIYTIKLYILNQNINIIRQKKSLKIKNKIKNTLKYFKN